MMCNLDDIDRATLERAHRFLETELPLDDMLKHERFRAVLHGAVTALARRKSNLESRQLKPIHDSDVKRRQAHDVDD